MISQGLRFLEIPRAYYGLLDLPFLATGSGPSLPSSVGVGDAVSDLSSSKKSSEGGPNRGLGWIRAAQVLDALSQACLVDLSGALDLRCVEEADGDISGI
jgi:hypothetical protein